MNNKTLALLNDLLYLVRKYGIRELEQLSKLLANPEFAEKARMIPHVTAKFHQEFAPYSTNQQINKSEAHLRELVEIARVRLADKDCYPNLHDVSEEIARLGVCVPPTGYKRREDAVRAAVKFLRDCSLDQASNFVKQLRTTTKRGSLEEWTQIIMDRR
ncbi:MAG: hypothetical protein NTX50_28610 [Candidatus Sumerlaeota bacterium]|nr:hypothetical protein [Candidatus Sumerlaeota bacterium]